MHDQHDVDGDCEEDDGIWKWNWHVRYVRWKQFWVQRYESSLMVLKLRDEIWEPLLLNAFNFEPGSCSKRWGCIESKFHVVVYASRHHGHGIHLKGRQVDFRKYDELLFILIPWLTALEVLPSPKKAQFHTLTDGGIHLINPLRYPGLKQRSKKHDVSKGRGEEKIVLADVWSPSKCIFSASGNFFKVPRRSRCCSCDFSNHCTLYEWTKTPGDL